MNTVPLQESGKNGGDEGKTGTEGERKGATTITEGRNATEIQSLKS